MDHLRIVPRRFHALRQLDGALFEADRTRQPYSPIHNRLVVSPETSRELLTAFVRGAKKQLLIYDEKVSDNLVQRVRVLCLEGD